ncbi:MAG: ribosome-associated translation inhibitor RaiA [Pseudomonadales bacterium]
MQIEIEPERIHVTEALEQHLHDSLAAINRRWGDRVTRVTMHLKDINSSAKGGIDKHCTLEARPAGIKPVAAEDTAADAYDAVKGAATKLEKVLEQALDRHKRRR